MDKALPPDWKDKLLETGPRVPMLDDGQPMTHRQLLMLATVSIAGERGVHLTGREVLELAEAAQRCIQLLLAMRDGEPLNTFMPNGDGV